MAMNNDCPRIPVDSLEEAEAMVIKGKEVLSKADALIDELSRSPLNRELVEKMKAKLAEPRREILKLVERVRQAKMRPQGVN